MWSIMKRSHQFSQSSKTSHSAVSAAERRSSVRKDERRGLQKSRRGGRGESGHIHTQCVPWGAAAGTAGNMAFGTRCSGREGMVLRSRCFGRVLGRRQPSTWLLKFQIRQNFSQLTSITCSLCCVSAAIGHFLAWSTRQIFFQGKDITVRHRVSTARAGTPGTALLSSHMRAIQVQMLSLEVLKAQPFSSTACVWSLWWPHFHLWVSCLGLRDRPTEGITLKTTHRHLSGLMTLPLTCWAAWDLQDFKPQKFIQPPAGVRRKQEPLPSPHPVPSNKEINRGKHPNHPRITQSNESLHLPDLQDPGPSQTSSSCHHCPKIFSPATKSPATGSRLVSGFLGEIAAAGVSCCPAFPPRKAIHVPNRREQEKGTPSPQCTSQ